MDIRQLHYFLVLCEEMNYTRAAQRLFLSRQALRQSITAEFHAFVRAIAGGDQELCSRMLDTSVAVSKVLTVARRSAGLKF